MQLVRQKNFMELAKTDEQRSFISAVFSGKKIERYQKDEMGDIIDLIGKWRYLVGVNSQLEPIELVALTDFILKNYGELTLPEINYAINLSLKGELNVDNKPYGSFSALYISNILNGYLDFKVKISKELMQLSDEYYEKQILEQKTTPPPPEVRAEDMKEMLRNAFFRYDKDKFFADPLSFIYRFLKNKGAFSNYDKNIIEKIKFDARIYAKNYKTDQSSPFLAAWDSQRDEDYIYIGRAKQLFCEYFLATFNNSEDFEKQFISTITSKDFL